MLNLLTRGRNVYTLGMTMLIRRTMWTCATLLVVGSAPPARSSSERAATPDPQFTSDGKLKLPRDYRAWAYVSTGFDMSYSESSGHSEGVFDNVFVPREAYDHFVRTSTWPDKTMFILELRQSS